MKVVVGRCHTRYYQPHTMTESTTTTKDVFDQLLKDIIGGRFGPGSRLPPERELAEELGTSRPTLRSAIARLTEWRIVLPKRGSGIAVMPKKNWSIEVCDAYLKYNRFDSAAEVQSVIEDILALRRGLTKEIIGMIAGRIAPGGTDKSWEISQRAWAARGRPQEFVKLDYDAARTLVTASDSLPAVWTFNRVAVVYYELSSTFSDFIGPTDRYLEHLKKMYTLIEAGHREDAMAAADELVCSHDSEAFKRRKELA